jgi:hypothetical protein
MNSAGATHRPLAVVSLGGSRIDFGAGSLRLRNDASRVAFLILSRSSASSINERWHEGHRHEVVERFLGVAVRAAARSRPDWTYIRHHHLTHLHSRCSTDLGLMAADLLASKGHSVVLHARNAKRAKAARQGTARPRRSWSTTSRPSRAQRM